MFGVVEGVNRGVVTYVLLIHAHAILELFVRVSKTLAEWALEGISVEVGIPTFALQFSIKQVSQKWSKIVQYGQYTGNFACFGAFIEKKD